MTSTDDPWGRPHRRLDRVVHGGLTRPDNDQRVARNGYWHLARPGVIEPAGWGDLNIEDLERIAEVLEPDEIFLVVREHVGLPTPLSPPGGFDWNRRPPPIPTPAVVAASVTWAVVENRCVRITFESHPGIETMTEPQLAARLTALLHAT